MNFLRPTEASPIIPEPNRNMTTGSLIIPMPIPNAIAVPDSNTMAIPHSSKILAIFFMIVYSTPI